MKFKKLIQSNSSVPSSQGISKFVKPNINKGKALRAEKPSLPMSNKNLGKAMQKSPYKKK